MINVVAGGDPVELAAMACISTRSAYELTGDSFIFFDACLTRNQSTLRRLFAGSGCNSFAGIQNLTGTLFGGSSPIGQQSRLSMSMLSHLGEPRPMSREIDAVRKRLHPSEDRSLWPEIHILYATPKSSVGGCDELLRYVSDESIAAARRRLRVLIPKAKKDGPTPWCQRDRLRLVRIFGPGLLVRGGAARRWLRSRTVTARLKEYAALGIDTYPFGYPHLEEAYRVAELLFPSPGRPLAETNSRLRRPVWRFETRR